MRINRSRKLCACLAAIVLAHGIAAQTAAGTPAKPAPWWKHAVIYEIYPRSFQDSNGDGTGDINGIIERLDYLQQMNVDAIWLTPIFSSPQVDFGYDISDFTKIDPRYGTMQDFDRLLAETRRRHIHVIMDLVLNHTSDQHPWFLESASSRTNPKRDWYLWQDGKPSPNGTPGPPNNWIDRTGQSAWRYFPETGQFNYHFFAPEQPDLNWRNPEVEAAVFQAVRFWLDKGVDGFRLDAINNLFERADFLDEPPVPGTNEYGEPSLSMQYQRNLPEVHTVLRDLRRLVDGYPGDRVLIGEIYTQSTAEMKRWYGEHDDEIQLPMDTNVGFLNHLNAARFRKLLGEAEDTHTPLYVFDNHDQPRSWDRYGDGVHNQQIAKIIATTLLAPRAASLMYQGQELGLKTIVPTRLEDVRDPRGIANWPTIKGRDGERTPMQWDASSEAGFTVSARPWLPIQTDYASVNVQSELAAPDSLLNWYKSLLRFRKDQPELVDGDMILLNRDAQDVLVWLRISAQRDGRKSAVIVANNMSDKPVTLSIGHDLASAGISGSTLRALLCSAKCPTLTGTDALTLQPFESYLGRVSTAPTK